MKYYTIIFLLFLFKFFPSQEEKISFLDFGIINISSELLLDEAKWEVSLVFKDTNISFEKKSSSDQQSLGFNLNEKVDSLDILKNLPIVIVKKNGKVLYKQKRKFNYKNDSKYILLTHEMNVNKYIKGRIIDSYKIPFNKGEFYVIRSTIKNLYNYWYLVKENEIINIHSEKEYNQPLSMGKIILTDLDNNKIPEISFFYQIDNKIKMIHFKNYTKIIAYKKEENINIPSQVNELENLIYKGFFYYNLKKISE